MGGCLWTIPEKCGLFLKMSDLDFGRIRSEVWSIVEHVAFSTFPSEETATLRGSENQKTEDLIDLGEFLNWNITDTVNLFVSGQPPQRFLPRSVYLEGSYSPS